MNFIGVVLFLVLTFFLSLFLDYLSPKLITLGWISYLVLVFLESVVLTIINLFSVAILYPFAYLITSNVAKIICAVIGIIGFIYSVSTPWQYANIIGYRFIVIIWCFTLTIFIAGLFYSILVGSLISPIRGD
jgi:hypothetical protein